MRTTAGLLASAVLALGGSLAVPGGPAGAAPSSTAVAVPVAVAPAVRFLGVQYDSPGKDYRTPASLDAEWIQLVNDGTHAVDLTGYRVADAAGRVYRFAGRSLAAHGGKVTLHTGKGRPTSSDVFWGSGNYIWNNDRDTATLHDPAGRLIDTCGWESMPGRTWLAC